MKTPENSPGPSALRALTVSEALMLLFWLGVAAATWTFMQGANHFLKLTPEELGKYFDLRWVLISHITAGGLALVLGPPQFSERLRLRYRRAHRTIGAVYLLAIAVSGTGALVLALTTAKAINWPYAFSLQVWVSVWISASFIAYQTARQKKFKLHKEWMTRSYIVTLAFVVSGLLLKVPLVRSMGSMAEVSPSLFWLGWSVPLYLYEILLTARRRA